MRRLPALLAALVSIVGVASCDTDDGRTMREPTSEQRAQATIEATTTTSTTIASTAIVETVPATMPASFTVSAPWPDATAIDARFTCDGAAVSPSLEWTAPPDGTAELALVVTDEDVSFIHWALTGLPPTAGSLAEGGVPDGVIQAVNDFGARGWGGPCPPAGQTHTYRFQLYALGTPPDVEPGVDARELLVAIEPLEIASAAITGTYSRP